jgi:copper chaperone
MEKVTLKIEGMSCGSCAKAVRGALEAVVGVDVERVDVGSASVRFDPTRTNAARIARAVEQAGYEVAGEEAIS